MSLIYALLNEGYRDPRDVYIALRTDGAAGSGTIDDPYDGSSRALPGETVSLTHNRRRIRVSTQTAHYYSANREILISGVVTGPDTGIYNGTFHVEEVLSPTEFTLLLTNPPTAVPWWQDTVLCTTTSPDTSFAVTLSWPWVEITSNSSLRFSDGDVFRISGAADATFNGTFVLHNPAPSSAGTMARYRLAVAAGADVASPINITAEKLVYGFDAVMRSLPENAVVHLGPGDFETRGYSWVDPSWQPKRGQKIRGSGMGATTLRLVGARHPAVGGLGIPTHAIGADYYPPLDYLEISDLTIDCNLTGQIALKDKKFAEVSCGAIGVPGSHTRVQRVRAINFGTQNRDAECFVMALAGKHPNLPEIVGSTIEDCVIERPSPNNFRETTCFMMGGRTPAQHRGCVIRHSLVICAYPATTDYPAGVSSEMVAIKQITPVGGNQYLVETIGPHLRTASNNVKISSVGVRINGVSEESVAFNGVFAIDEVPLPNKFKYTPGQTPEGNDLNLQNATIGVDFHAFGVEGGTAAVAEGNWAFHTRLGYYTDTGSSKDSIVRDNVFYDVVTGPYLLLGNLMDPPITGSKVENPYPAHADIALFTCLTAHGLWPGAVVAVSDVLVDGSLTNYFNDTVEVKEVPVTPVDPSNGNPTTFTYQMKGVPPALAITGIPKFRELYRSRTITVENNLIVLSPSLQSDSGPSIALLLGRFAGAYPFIYRQGVLRGNVVGQLGDVPDPRALAAMQVSVEQGLTEENLCRVTTAEPLREWPSPESSHIRYFNNLRESNGIAEGSVYYDDNDQRSISGLEATLEMALLLSL